MKTCLSLGLAVLANLRPILVSLIPYLVFLGSFGLFVLWNGGVVLGTYYHPGFLGAPLMIISSMAGHKEFHTAGLHLPQMLYIWPCFMFFSWPVILLPPLLLLWRQYRSGTPRASVIKTLPRIWLALLCIAAMAIVVHLNTIVHPFTLADNRHYVFYAFRILLRHPIVKYIVTPVYFACASLSLGTFGNEPSGIQQVHELSSNIQDRSFTPQSAPHQEPPSPPLNQFTSASKASTIQATPNTRLPEGSTTSHPSTSPASTATTTSQQEQVKTSFLIIWLATTTLSLITAPLVEPRYFVIPWVMWRLHLRPASVSILGIELAWHVVVNVVTGYVFLFKGFEWSQEPGVVQRFMW